MSVRRPQSLLEENGPEYPGLGETREKRRRLCT